jgi:hypothetical protein
LFKIEISLNTQTEHSYRKYIFFLGASNSTKAQITTLLVDAASATPLELGMDGIFFDMNAPHSLLNGVIQVNLLILVV